MDRLHAMRSARESGGLSSDVYEGISVATTRVQCRANPSGSKPRHNMWVCAMLDDGGWWHHRRGITRRETSVTTSTPADH
jgi:hypothetical protein